MRFINREREMELLLKAKERSRRKLYSVAIYGLRRVGKTRLLREFLSENDLYFFVNRGKSSALLLREYSEILRGKGILSKREELKSWDDFFEVLFERFTGAVAFDEFQDFRFVEPSVYSTLQRFMDENEEKPMLLIFTGSTIGMVERLFKDSKEPLYGRIKRELRLEPLDIRGSYEMAREVGIENLDDFITLYSVFGGFPRYWVAVEDEGLEGENAERILKELIFSYSAPLEEEVPRILSLEFGKRSGVYYDILEAIANGSTSPSEIAGYLNRKETSITRQLHELVNYFKLVDYDRAVLGKGSVLYIRHPFLNFWFRFVQPRLSEYELNRERLWEDVKRNLPDYVGKRFDFACRELLRLSGNFLPFQPTVIGRHWGRYREGGKRKVYEIDIIALDSEGRKAIFGECKWRKRTQNAEKLLEKLRGKVELTGWRGEVYYLLIARKLRNVPENVIALDEKGIKNLLEGEK
ncbi:ATP-binding protein [Thermococcus gammatolerans]|uniref:Prokaryotic ATPase, AAA superfamily n=1 Tax=Thermococcus gammatolerans (strain DSM 15229 / JCM 11827 / EJ3) TaxID=593117 RepID=C5A3G5_THEGJ|nr:ATP-binding protein [Thermococcus gammatolerans]ACS32777.1 Prokaryotic ATPase, AAA superfamily [Thermococcus gammatolerans EJ3]